VLGSFYTHNLGEPPVESAHDERILRDPEGPARLDRLSEGGQLHMAVNAKHERLTGPVLTEVRLRLLDQEQDGLIGFASCVLDDMFFLNNVAIRRGSDGGLFLTFPATRSKGGTPHFHWNPITAEAANMIENAVLGRLREISQGFKSPAVTPGDPRTDDGGEPAKYTTRTTKQEIHHA